MNLRVGEISAIDTFNTKFDLIITHSIFQYFDNYMYAKSLILKMLSNLKKYLDYLQLQNSTSVSRFTFFILVRLLVLVFLFQVP